MQMKKMMKRDAVQAKKKKVVHNAETKKKGEKGKEKEKEDAKKDGPNHLRILCYELLSKV